MPSSFESDYPAITRWIRECGYIVRNARCTGSTNQEAMRRSDHDGKTAQ
jgi:hypothetical protein